MALGMLGCGDEDADWYVDDRFSAEECIEIDRGATWLYAQAGRPAPVLRWTYRVTSESPYRRTIRRDPMPGHPVTQHGGSCTSLEGNGTVYLWPDPEAPQLAGLTAHELAHCELGFVDRYRAVDGSLSDGIMRVLTPMLWTESEREQCERSDRCHVASPK